MRRSVDSTRGRCEAVFASPRLLETRMTGYFDIKIADWLITQFDAWWDLGGQQMVAFHDWFGIDDYDADVRAKMSDWTNRHRSRFVGAHLLIRSKAAVWGIRVFNNVTGGLVTTYSDRSAFELEREKARASSR